jgi:hypothetical protein
LTPSEAGIEDSATDLATGDDLNEAFVWMMIERHGRDPHG